VTKSAAVISVTIDGRSVSVPPGTTVLEAARRLSLGIESPCGGNGTCGKCGVSIGGETALACQSAITAPVEITTEKKEDENKTLQILSGGSSFKYPLKPAYPDGCGIVIDIGTTTLVAELIELGGGRRLAGESRLNPQSVFAQDVLSRISYASEDDGLKTLQRELQSALNEMIADMRRSAGGGAVREAVYSGNTAMLHIACGVNPSPLGKFPYDAPLECGRSVKADGLNIDGDIYLPPIISAFVGADITSGILASRLHERKETTLFIDIGTNGEIVLATDGRLTATSTAAGPAFEGMNIACGMRAARGAVERFEIDGDGTAVFSVIGGGEPTGICGSGLFDIASALVRSGIVGKSGRFTNGARQYDITDKVFITQKDIRQLQLAKGAVRTGIDALLRETGVDARGVDRVEIAGSFGYHLSERSLLDIKLLPPELEGRVHFVGNTSQAGGTAFLLNTDFREEMRRVVSEVRVIELAADENFQARFIASLGF
jgi:uncharacterized 2Fe-2S/4Fe-4S cluster protein (DUF4445 family)